MSKTKTAANAFIDLVTPNKPKTSPLSAAKEAETLSPFQVAQQNAQRNAALPVEQGGLGLPPNNTAEDRLAAQNYYDYLHGTQRLDRLLEGEGLDPKRATSGPMPYGTDKPELASRYATGKADTSRYDAGKMSGYFQVAPKDLGARGKNLISVEQSWHYLSPEQQKQILSGYYRTGYANPEEGSGAFTLHPEGTHGSIASKAHLDHVLKEERGNPLAALRNLWGESGELYDNPEDLSQIFKMAGYPYNISQTNAPWTTAQGVMLGKARMDNPLRTSDTDNLINNVIPSLREQFKGDRTRLKVGADQWAKESRYTPNQWLEELEKDVLAGKNSFVWTSIPDKVTGALKQLGHDGIIDLGGKTGGEGHQVVIPFDPTQVRSKFAAFDPMEKSSADLLKAHGGIIRKADGGMVDSVPEEAIKNTVRDPQAARLLDLDLAKYALMNQPQRMAGGGAMKKIVKAATKPAALSQAEKDANLKQWMSSGKIRTDEGDPQRLYHITPKDFDQFKAGGDDPTMSGVATWLTDNPEYQPAMHNVGTRQEGVFKEGTNVMPVYSNASQPLLIDDPEMQQWANDVFAGGRNELPYQVSPNTAKAIKEAGYDYIHYADPHKSNEPHEYIMLDPERQIKSAIGNRGTYDPNEPSITKAHGGAVRMAQGGQVLSEAIGGQVQTPVQGDMSKMTFEDYRKSIGMHEGGRHMAQGGQVQRFDEGGQVSQDQMRYELANSPVMQATPRSPMQDFIGTVGGYMDKAGKFVSEAIEPTAEKHPVKHFLANMILADSLKSAGTLMQDLTGTVRETDEDNPVRGVISKDWKNLTTSREPMLDPRALDLAGFASPVVKGVTKLAGAGAKAITPFATRVDDMVRELSASGAIPQPGLSIKDVTPKALAPANEQGFYSPTEAAALNLQRKSGNGQAFLNDLMKGENVKPDEINAMGLDTFLKDKKNVTAAEVQDYIAQNKIQLGESVYGGKQKGNFLEFLKEKGYPDDEALRILNKAEDGNMDGQVSALRDEYLDLSVKPTKFGQYQLPGGKNYREVVITTPLENSAALEAAKIKAGDARRQTADLSVQYRNQKEIDPQSPRVLDAWKKLEESRNLRDQAEAEADALRRVASEKTYRSSHFDEPNVLAHLRMSDRVTDGKKTLLVDEVQSDWHQAGRERGYNSPDPIKKNADGTYTLTKPDGTQIEMPARTDIEMFRRAAALDTGVPDAPYKEDWYQLALRRAVKEAIDGGYDRVALPTGARVAERFSLTKYIDRIAHKKNADGTYSLAAVDKEGRTALNDKSVPQDKLAGIVGKEVAQKIIDAEGKGYPKGSVSEDMLILSGLDLKVGGEGMKKYYDEIYPNYLKKFGKKYGSTVGKTTVDVEGAAEPLHYMDITPAMRKEFSTGIHMAKGGKVSFAKSADDMRKELLRNKHG